MAQNTTRLRRPIIPSPVLAVTAIIVFWTMMYIDAGALIAAISGVVPILLTIAIFAPFVGRARRLLALPHREGLTRWIC